MKGTAWYYDFRYALDAARLLANSGCRVTLRKPPASCGPAGQPWRLTWTTLQKELS